MNLRLQREKYNQVMVAESHCLFADISKPKKNIVEPLLLVLV